MLESVQKSVIDRTTEKNVLATPRQLRLFWRRRTSQTVGYFTAAVTAAVCALVVIITIALLIRTWPILETKPLGELLFSNVWKPAEGLFGYFPFIIGSASVTLLAMVLAVPFAILSAIYLADYTRFRGWLKPVIDLLASIPSVVYGLWGVLFVVPAIRTSVLPFVSGTFIDKIPFFEATNPTGYGLLAAGIVLAIMVFPIIVAVLEEVLRTVPQGMKEASLALGATEWETTKWVVLKHARAGIVAAVVLGFSRAFGETLAVMMVIGNTAQIPASIFDSVYPLPALIANNYGEMMSVRLYDAALMGAALILLLVVLAFNFGARLVIRRFAKV